MAYKKDVDDARESPSFVLMDLLREGGADVSYNDPHVPTLPRTRQHGEQDLLSSPLTAEFLADQDWSSSPPTTRPTMTSSSWVIPAW